MYHFFVSPENIRDKHIIIEGTDVNHIKNVLRMKVGDEISVSNGIDGREYRCGITAMGDVIDCELRFVKEAGVEFVIIRVGGTKGREGDYFLDKSFIYNITNANKVGLPVGLYFFSYATSPLKAKENANYVLEQIKGYKVELPISFDWENWNNFNKYHISFYELTKMANTFIDTVEKAGYQGMNYGSKAYVENMWLPSDNITWLAHYTSKTNYEGKYKFWQICDNALVDGIDGPVDVNIMFEE